MPYKRKYIESGILYEEGSYVVLNHTEIPESKNLWEGEKDTRSRTQGEEASEVVCVIKRDCSFINTGSNKF